MLPSIFGKKLRFEHSSQGQRSKLEVKYNQFNLDFGMSYDVPTGAT